MWGVEIKLSCKRRGRKREKPVDTHSVRRFLSDLKSSFLAGWLCSSTSLANSCLCPASSSVPRCCFPHGFSTRGLTTTGTAARRCFVVRPAEVLQEFGSCNQLVAASCVLPGQGGWCRDRHSRQHVEGIVEPD